MKAFSYFLARQTTTFPEWVTNKPAALHVSWSGNDFRSSSLPRSPLPSRNLASRVTVVGARFFADVQTYSPVSPSLDPVGEAGLKSSSVEPGIARAWDTIIWGNIWSWVTCSRLFYDMCSNAVFMSQPRSKKSRFPQEGIFAVFPVASSFWNMMWARKICARLSEDF